MALLRRKFPNLRHEVEHLGNGMFRVSSRTNRGEHYDVNINNKDPKCPCDGYKYRAWCTHIDDCIIYAIREGFATIETKERDDNQ